MIEAMPLLRLIRSVHAIAVDCAGTYPLDVAVPYLIGKFRQLDTLQFLFAARVKKTQLDLGCVCRELGEINAATVPSRTARVRQALAQADRLIAHRGYRTGRRNSSVMTDTAITFRSAKTFGARRNVERVCATAT